MVMLQRDVQISAQEYQGPQQYAEYGREQPAYRTDR